MSANRAARIRDFLATCKHGATAQEVTRALDRMGDLNAYSRALSALESTGMVRSTKPLGCRRVYTLGRAPKRRPLVGKVQTGRAARIRELLAARDRGFTVGEVRAAADPQATPNMVSASLFSLAKQGHIHRASQGRLGCYGRTPALARQALEAELARRAQPKPKAPTKPRQAATPKPRPTPKPKRVKKAALQAKPRLPKAPPARAVPRAFRSPPPPGEAMRTAMNNSARATPRQRPAPVTCALDAVPAFQRQLSERIAADIADFEAKGGRIERLGPTQFFKHIGMEAANTFPPRTPRTGTYDLDD